MPADTPSLFPEFQPSPVARDEMNFAEFPMAVLAARAPKGCTELVFEDTVLLKGKPITRRLTVTAAPKYGLPTVKDEEVLLGLLAITKQRNNFTDANVQFTRYELIQLLGLNDEGHSYQRITAALDCWSSVYLKYENAWWDNERKEHIDRGFHVIEQWSATRPQRGTRGGSVSFKWNEVAFRSFQANYVKQLDLRFYQSLETGVAKRLYRYLDKHLYHPPHRKEFELEDLAFCHLGLSRNYEVWKVKQKIEPGIRELEERGYLEAVPQAERFTKAGPGRYRVTFAKRVQRPKELAEAPKVEDSPLVAELVSRGLHADSARELVAKKSASAIAERIEAFDWLMGRKDKPEKPSGYLFKMIAKEYPLPDGFTPAAVKQAATAAKRREAVEQTLKARQDAEATRREREEHENRKARVEAFLKALSVEEQSAFEELALRSGPEEEVTAYRQAVERNLTSWAARVRYKLLERAMTDGKQAA